MICQQLAQVDTRTQIGLLKIRMDWPFLLQGLIELLLALFVFGQQAGKVINSLSGWCAVLMDYGAYNRIKIREIRLDLADTFCHSSHKAAMEVAYFVYKIIKADHENGFARMLKKRDTILIRAVAIPININFIGITPHTKFRHKHIAAAQIAMWEQALV